MIRELRVHAAPAKDPIQAPSTHIRILSQPAVTPAPEGPIPSSDLYGHLHTLEHTYT